MGSGARLGEAGAGQGSRRGGSGSPFCLSLVPRGPGFLGPRPHHSCLSLLHTRASLPVSLWLSISNSPLYKDISTELSSVLKVLNPMTFSETKFLGWGDLSFPGPRPWAPPVWTRPGSLPPSLRLSPVPLLTCLLSACLRLGPTHSAPPSLLPSLHLLSPCFQESSSLGEVDEHSSCGTLPKTLCEPELHVPCMSAQPTAWPGQEPDYHKT